MTHDTRHTCRREKTKRTSRHSFDVDGFSIKTHRCCRYCCCYLTGDRVLLSCPYPQWQYSRSTDRQQPCKAQQRQSPLTRRPNFLGSILLSYPRASVAGEKNVHGLEVSVPGLVLVEMGQPAGHVFDQAAFPLHTRIIQRTTAPRTR